MRQQSRRRRWLVAMAAAGLAMVATPATADWIGEYWPLWVGNSWTYENAAPPGDSYTDTVFEYLVYDGDQAVKLGQPDDYRVIGNTGHVITVYAETEDGELFDYPQHVVVGEYEDGSVFEICFETPCDSNLIRDWEAIDPALRDAYGLDPSWDDLVLVVSYHRGQPPNQHNVVAASNLPAGLAPPAGAVTSLEWYQRNLGMVAIADIEAASGILTEFYKLVDVHVGVPGEPVPPVVASLAPNRPNPFNPRTTITYHLNVASRPTLTIHDLAGRRVRTLAAGEPRPAGSHTATWDGCDGSGRPQPSGTYVCRLQAGTETHVRRLSLVR